MWSFSWIWMCWLLVPIVSELPQLAVPYIGVSWRPWASKKSIFFCWHLWSDYIYVSVSISYKSWHCIQPVLYVVHLVQYWLWVVTIACIICIDISICIIMSWIQRVVMSKAAKLLFRVMRRRNGCGNTSKSRWSQIAVDSRIQSMRWRLDFRLEVCLPATVIKVYFQ